MLFFAQCPYDKVLGASNLPMLRYEWVWYKSRCTGFLNARRAPLKKTENILVFYQKLPLYNPQFEQGKPYKKIAGNRGDSTNYGKFIRSGSGSEDGLRFPGNVLAFPTVQRTIHPTQKPVELCEYFIKTYTRPGEVVADICAGSGSTAVAALNTGRRFICFETVPAYYAAASEASVRRGQRWRLGRKEFNYRTLFYHLCRSPLALHSEKGTGGGGKPLPNHEHIGAMCVACGRPCGQGQRAFFVGHIPAAPGGPAADPGVGFTYKSVAFVWLKQNRKSPAGFTAWAFGHGATRRSACWRHGDTPNGRRRIFTSLSFPRPGAQPQAGGGREKIVALMGDLPRVELFARQSPAGWDVWGNEVEPTIPDFWTKCPEAADQKEGL